MIKSRVSSGNLPLPLDADGTPINVGDVVEVKSYVPSVFKVTIIRYSDADNDAGYTVTVMVRDARAGESDDYEKYPLLTFSPDKLRHYHEPTVEDVLDELEGMRGSGAADYEAVVMRCADLAETLRKLLKESKDEDQA